MSVLTWVLPLALAISLNVVLAQDQSPPPPPKPQLTLLTGDQITNGTTYIVCCAPTPPFVSPWLLSKSRSFSQVSRCPKTQ